MKKRITVFIAVLLCLCMVACGEKLPAPQESGEQSEISADLSLPDTDVSEEISDTEEDGYTSDTVLVLPEDGPAVNAAEYDGVKNKISEVFTKNQVRDEELLIVVPAMVGWEPSPLYSPMGNAYYNTGSTALNTGDVIKNDENFIYCLSFGELTIFSAENGKAEQVSLTHLPEQLLGIEMLLYENKVIIICANQDPYRDYAVTELSESGRGAVTCVFVIEVSESGKTKQTDFYVQSGYFVSCHTVGDEMVLLTKRHTRLADKFYGDNALSDEELMRELPVAGKHLNATVPAENIEIPDDTGLSTLTITSKTNLQSGKMNAYCKMINDSYFFITEDSIYVFDQSVHWYGNDGRAHLEIERYDITGEKPVYIGKTSIHGWMHPLAVSEYNGYLRIPTDEDYGAGLVILDKELNIVSELYGIGGNQKEPYPHDMATYKNVAVFGRGTTWYVVDVSDPAAPKVMNGIDGANQNYDKAFLSEDTLLTAVFCRDDAKEYNGIKLETYDISDEKNIVKTGEILLENNSRELMYRLSPWSYRQSVSAVSEKEFTVVPYTIEYWEYDDYVRKNMLALFSTEDGLTLVSKQEIERAITEGTKTSKWQAMYIDGTVYFVNMALGTKETDITAINIYTFNSTYLTPTGRYTND